MNELLEQFLVETRELVQSATDDLLALEVSPGDAEAVNRVFRAFHTLKGSVGLFDYPAWFAVLHAAEDGLSAARAGTLDVDAALVDLSLETLDATARWADAVEATERLPDAAASEAAALSERYRSLVSRGRAAPATEAVAIPKWVDRLVATSDYAVGAAIAVRYEPRADCFFSGDDPLGLVRKVPGLRAVKIEPVAPWPPEEEIDVYACNLVVMLLASAPRGDVEAVFRLVGDQVALVEVPAAIGPAAGAGPSEASGQVVDPVVAAVLAEQVRVLFAPTDAAIETGRVETCARAAANALRSAERDRDAELCERAAGRDAEAVAAAISSILSEPLQAISKASVPPPAGEEAGETMRQDPSPGGDTSRSLRVDAVRVDALVAGVGELVVARNALGHLAARAEAGEDAASLARGIREADATIGRLATALHRGAVSLRLTPLSQVFRRFARPVREAARGLGKEVELDVRGEDTEADKAIVDNLFEPLLHVVRNAVDHGLEDVETRRQSGKPAAGRVRIRAGQDGDGIVVSVSDDGRGLDPAFIRRRAVERGLRSAEAVAALDDAAVTDLIFEPGFSTAENVGALSGRGVGMDAVRAAAERMGGRVGVDSRVGNGTTVSLHLPRSVALVRVMMVAAGGATYGVAMDAIEEVVRRPRADVHSVAGGTATVHRGRTLPVIPLADLVAESIPSMSGQRSDALLLVVHIGGERVALEVDGIEDRLDTVVRPPVGLVGTVPGVAGTAMLGDGRVLLILDPASMLADPSTPDQGTPGGERWP